MTGGEHRDVARRVLHSLGKLSLEQDFRPAIEAAIVAAYHLANAALHDSGISQAHEHHNVPSRASLDAERLPPKAGSAWDAFVALEGLRSDHIKRFTPYSPRAAEILREALRDLAHAQPESQLNPAGTNLT